MLVEGTVNVLAFGTLAVGGSISMTNAGLVASLQVGGGASQGFTVPGFVLSGYIQLEINTTSSEQIIRVMDIAEDGSVLGFKDGTIAALTVRLAGSAQLTLGGVFEIGGSIEMVFSVDGFELHVRGTMGLGAFGSLKVDGAAAIRNENGTPIFAAKINVSIKIGIPLVSIYGSGTLEINTSSSTTYFDVAPSTFRIHIMGTVQVMLFKIDATIDIVVQGGLFRFAVDAELSFYGFINIHVTGFVQSDGQFMIQGVASIRIDLGPLVGSGEIGVTFSNTSFRAWIDVSVELDISLPWPFNILRVTIGGRFRAEINVGWTYATVSFTVQVYLQVTLEIDFGFFSIDITFGSSFTFGGSYTWSWGAPPDIAYQVGDTVYINVGADGYRRGAIYTDIAAESVTITPNGDPHSIKVESLGATETFSGVNNIVVNDAGDSTDNIYVGEGIAANFFAHGGSGNDTITYLGSGVATLYGDDGNDVIRNGSGSGFLYGGAGNDIIIGGSGIDVIYGGTGNDTIDGGGGSDTINGDEGDDTIEGGTAGASSASDTDQLFGGVGNDTLTSAGGINSIMWGGYGTDTFFGVLVLSYRDAMNIASGGGGMFYFVFRRYTLNVG